MKIKTVKLDKTTLAILLRSSISGCNLTLPKQLPRGEYMMVAKAIEAAGGKWNRKAQCHVFPHDVRETLDIKEDTVSVTDIQQTFQAFYTPPEIADQLAILARLNGKQRILEPSAGDGALIHAAQKFGAFALNVTAVEINPKRITELACFCGTVIEKDFLEVLPGDIGLFDRVIMNPPFTRGASVLHVRHAVNFLKPQGHLVAIVDAGPRTEAALKPLASEWNPIPAGAFKSSGTNVSTVMMAIDA